MPGGSTFEIEIPVAVPNTVNVMVTDTVSPGNGFTLLTWMSTDIVGTGVSVEVNVGVGV
jgi:hypothetical protein